MSRADELRALLARVEEAEGGDLMLEADLLALLGGPIHDWPKRWLGLGFHPTLRVDEARDLIRRVLPDWWASSGLCSLTGHASIGPDYNGPAAERLKAEWPEERFHEGFHADLKPGDGPHRECLALIAALLSALLAREADHG
ncbi:hypothetical protein FF100_04620 [Methylobacterium terricola]|uniref:Uncharacterized protein n=1 Tax=Methylobacterium terricola TaxID=2583531 RepID=A0A5C4LK55_9HYPH|nr:hypothetical protein [Methylobacterium terricola]TNC14866.1 hypothetical protein FF100_04620 [Methylobacterium terricola]